MKENCLWYWQKKRQGKCRKDSPELKDALLRRMLPPNNESITKISREEGISEQTLRNWRDKARRKAMLLLVRMLFLMTGVHRINF